MKLKQKIKKLSVQKPELKDSKRTKIKKSKTVDDLSILDTFNMSNRGMISPGGN